MLLYIDPGSGSLILQIVIASFSGIIVFVSSLRGKILAMFLKIKQFCKQRYR